MQAQQAQQRNEAHQHSTRKAAQLGSTSTQLTRKKLQLHVRSLPCFLTEL